MKKIISLLIATTMLISFVSLLSACDSGSKTKVDSDGIAQVVTHIKSNESSKALSKCQSFNQETLESGKSDILDAIKEKLDYCISHSSYNSSTYLVNERTIEE